jgi:hypothetical protein
MKSNSSSLYSGSLYNTSSTKALISCCSCISKFPCAADHGFEVVIVVDGSRNVLVVILKFGVVDGSVSLEGVPLGEEFTKNLVLGHLAVSEFRVEGNVVDAL